MPESKTERDKRDNREALVFIVTLFSLAVVMIIMANIFSLAVAIWVAAVWIGALFLWLVVKNRLERPTTPRR